MEKVRLRRDAPHPPYYLKDGSEVAGASSVAKMGEDMGGLLWWYYKQGKDGKTFKGELNKAADTGSIGHFLVDCYLKGAEADLREYTKSEIDGGQEWFDKARRFLQDNPVETLGVELRMVSESLRYGGTLDYIGKTETGKIRLTDWKSSKRIYDSQLRQVVGGYRMLWNELNPAQQIDEVVIVRIPKDKGKYDAHWVDPSEFEKHGEIFKAQTQLFNCIKESK